MPVTHCHHHLVKNNLEVFFKHGFTTLRSAATLSADRLYAKCCIKLLHACQFPVFTINKLCGSPPHYAPASFKLTFGLLTLKMVSESRVTWATSVPILVLGLSVLDLGPMYATDRQTSDVICAISLNAPYPMSGA